MVRESAEILGKMMLFRLVIVVALLAFDRQKESLTCEYA